MNVTLTPGLEEFVQKKVRSGKYNSADEVVMEALVMMDEQERIAALSRDEIREMIEEGLESLRAGRMYDGEEVFDRIEAELRAKSNRR